MIKAVLAGVVMLGLGTSVWAACDTAECPMEKCPMGAATTQPAASAKEYICPMKCAGSESDKAGKCPKCGMDLVPNHKHPATQPAAAV